MLGGAESFAGMETCAWMRWSAWRRRRSPPLHGARPHKHRQQSVMQGCDSRVRLGGGGAYLEVRLGQWQQGNGLGHGWVAGLEDGRQERTCLSLQDIRETAPETLAQRARPLRRPEPYRGASAPTNTHIATGWECSPQHVPDRGTGLDGLCLGSGEGFPLFLITNGIGCSDRGAPSYGHLA